MQVKTEYYIKNTNPGRSNLNNIMVNGELLSIVFRKEGAKYYLGSDLSKAQLDYFRSFKTLGFILVHKKVVFDEMPLDNVSVEEKPETIEQEPVVEQEINYSNITYDDMDKMGIDELMNVNALKIRGYLYNRYYDSPDIENLHSKESYLDFLKQKREGKI